MDVDEIKDKEEPKVESSKTEEEKFESSPSATKLRVFCGILLAIVLTSVVILILTGSIRNANDIITVVMAVIVSIGISVFGCGMAEIIDYLKKIHEKK